MPRALAIIAFLLGLHFPAAAQDACSQFDWPVSQERSLFSTPGLAEIASGGALKLASSSTATVRLKEMGDVQFTRTPERMPRNANSFGGVIEIDGIGEAGLYQITVSEAAWIDVIQNDAFVKAAGHSGKHGCPEVRKSVRFALAKGPVVIQFSGVDKDSVKLAILKVAP